MEPKRPSYDALQKMVDKLQADLEDRLAIEKELAHMASFSEMAPNPIVETDTHQRIYYVNPAALGAFPDLAHAGINHPIFKGFQDILATMRRDHKSMLTRPIILGEKTYDQRIAILDGGPRVRFYFSDITELKRLDQLKTDFVNMVSHELRSPMTTIQASISMAVHGMLGELTPEQKEALKLSLTNIERLSRLINELLDISKIEAGKLEIQCVSADLGTLVKEVARSFEPLAHQRGLTLKTHLPREPILILIDRDKIVQVFTNLLQNAMKFTSHGSVEVAVDHQLHYVRCYVADTGPGIAESDLPKVFGKFQQFRQPPEGREKGTGLGLSLCKGFIENHGGKIWVESQEGVGTRFIFDLPKTPVADATSAKATRP